MMLLAIRWRIGNVVRPVKRPSRLFWIEMIVVWIKVVMAVMLKSRLFFGGEMTKLSDRLNVFTTFMNLLLH